MVAATVEVAQGLCFSAFTTTRPSTAIRMIMIIAAPISAAQPPTGPSSSRAIWPRLRPWRRVDRNMMTISCTQPPSTEPARIHSVPGQVAELHRERGTDEGPRTGDRGEVMTEDDPAVGGDEVAAVVEPLGGGGAGRVEGQDARRDPRRVEAIGDEIDARRRRDEPAGVDGLAAMRRDDRQRRRAGESQARPADFGNEGHARFLLAMGNKTVSRYANPPVILHHSPCARGVGRREGLSNPG